MKKRSTSQQPKSFTGRLRKRLVPEQLPVDDRGRMRMVIDTLVFHIHPPKVPIRTLQWSFTWGLGGMAAVLFAVLIVTGMLLEINYTPSPPQAYLDIINLKTNVWFGSLIRNLHHWAGNFMVVIVTLHLLRVFFTGSHRPPRELNWLIGIAMLILVLGANFTGYLLPWDQLAFWAITVGTSLIAYVPLVGSYLSQLLLGGPEVGKQTLLAFYSMHISFMPIALVALMSMHFWKVRKDGGGLTIPKSPGEGDLDKIEKVTTIPYLLRRELVYAVVGIALLLVWAAFVPAPLEGIANPEVSPNPAKAPWYFMGLQELLVHFHPLIGTILIPFLGLGALALLPFYDFNAENTGVYFRSQRGRYLVLLTVGLVVIFVPLWVVVDDFLLLWTQWLPTWPPLISNGFIPLAVVLLALFVFDQVIKRLYKTSMEERILIMFTFLFTGLIILTVIGIFFRGQGMNLYWPWDMPAIAH